METWLSVVGDDGRGLHDLYSWLAEQAELRGAVSLAKSRPPADRMGSLTDALVVAVGGGGLLTTLAHALMAWMKLQRSAEVHVTAIDPDGSVTRIDATGVTDVERLLRAALHGGPGRTGSLTAGEVSDVFGTAR